MDNNRFNRIFCDLLDLWTDIAPDVIQNTEPYEVVEEDDVRCIVGDRALDYVPGWRDVSSSDQHELLRQAFPPGIYS